MTTKGASDRLERKIRSALWRKLSPTGEGALRAFLNVPGVLDWDPTQLGLGELSFIFDVGLPLAILSDVPSLKLHLKDIASAVRLGAWPPENLWSEIQVAALLTNLGASVSFVPRGVRKTPDLETSWASGDLDVEVTRADTRWHHKDVQRRLSYLIQTLKPSDLDWHVVCFFSDASDPIDLSEAIEAASSLSPNRLAQKVGRWAVRAVPLDQRDDVIGGEAIAKLSPEWWPKGEPNFRIQGTVIGSSKLPVVSMWSLVPRTSYIRPIQTKAESGQHRTGRSYLIAVETTKLPAAHTRLNSELTEWLTGWEHVGGVMLFEPRFWMGIETKEWNFALYGNPRAIHRLPPPLPQTEEGCRQTVTFALST